MKTLIAVSTVSCIAVAAFLAGCQTPAPSHDVEKRDSVSAKQDTSGQPVARGNGRTPESAGRQSHSGTAYSPARFSVWRSVGSIIFILGGLLAAHTILRRRQSISPCKDSAHIKIVERLMIDHKRSIVLLEVDGTRILVGGTQDKLDSMAVIGRSENDTETCSS